MILLIHVNLCCGCSLELPCRGNCLAEMIQMSTHNIGFHEEQTKIIFQLSSDNYHQIHVLSNEPRREKTGFLHMRKQRRRSASR